MAKTGIESVNSNYVSPFNMNSLLEVTSIQDTFILESGWNISPKDDIYEIPAPKITVTFPNGTTQIFDGKDAGGSIELKTSGAYSILYEFGIVRGSANPQYAIYRVRFTFAAVRNYAPLPKWSVTDVINRVLDLAEPHRQKDAAGNAYVPRYKLNAAQAAEFASIEAPEFAFTNLTLRECLDQIGGFIHGMARLRIENGERVIYYDMLGLQNKAKLSDPKYPCIYEIKGQNLESYATELDSAVENLVTILDRNEGAVTEPYAGGFKSVRSEEQYARIVESNMVISTTMPIYAITKLEMQNPKNASEYKDITAYVFEGADYGRLSSFDKVYPASKAYAIYYEVGQNNIKGLAYKPPNIIDPSLSDYTITNIAKEVFGIDISSSFWNENTGDYPKLSFRITYIPVFSSRVTQHKPYIRKGETKRTLCFNQSANLVETRYYGENMKGAIARIGNVSLTRTYRIKSSLSLLPRAGELWNDDYYVSAVTAAFFPAYVDCTIELSKDFNRISQYIGINAEWRAYEVSERKAYISDRIYTDLCIIGENDVVSDGLEIVDAGAIAVTFNQEWIVGGATAQLTAAVVNTYDAEEATEPMHTVTLPVISTAFGNTLVFSFEFADNYSAGTQSVYSNAGGVKGYYQTDVPYGDYYGRADSMTFELSTIGSGGNDFVFSLPNGDAVTPLGNSAQIPIKINADNRYVLRKDGSETIRMHYQIQFVTTMKDIIIGSALTHNCPMVSGLHVGSEAMLFALPTRIDKWANKIDLTGAALVSSAVRATFGAHKVNLYADFNNIGNNGGNGWESWAIVAPKKTEDNKTVYEILIAKNSHVADQTDIKLPTITLTHSY